MHSKKKEKERKTASQGEVETEQGWREGGERGDGKKGRLVGSGDECLVPKAVSVCV